MEEEDEITGDTGDEKAGKEGDQDIKNSLTHQKAHWRDKAQAAEAKAEEYKQKLAEVESRVSQVQTTTEALTLSTQFGLDAQDVKVLTSLAAGAGKTPEEMIDSDEFKTFREGKSNKRRDEDAIPEPSSRVAVVGDKSFSELPKADRQKNYAHTITKLVEKGRSRNRNIT